MIDANLLERYSMLSFEEAKERHGDTLDTEFTFYQTFLLQTDHIPNKIIEKMLEELAEVSLINFIEVFIRFISTVKTEYKDILQARKFARDKINAIQDELCIKEQNQVTD